MRFHFKAISRSGDVFEGDREAKDKFDLYRDLKIEGSTIISVNEPESRKFSPPMLLFPAPLGPARM